MPTITHLQTTNTAGRSFNLELSPLVAVCAPNFSGKTTLLNCIRLALAGKLPSAAKNADIFLMSSGRTMSILLDLSDGNRIERTLQQDGDSIRMTGSDSAEYVTPLLNAKEYFELTASERLHYIASRMPVKAKVDSKSIVDDLLRAWTEAKVETTSDEITDILCGITAQLNSKEGVAEGLTRLLDKGKKPQGYNLADRFTYWNGRQKDTIGAIRTLSELKNRESECSAETLAEIRQEIALLQIQLNTENQRKGQLTQAKATNERTAQRKTAIKQWLAKPVKGDWNEFIAELKGKIESDEKRLREIDLSGETAQEIMAKLSDNQLAMVKLTTTRDHMSEEASRILEEIANIEHELKCPTCGSSTKEWKKRKSDRLEAAKISHQMLKKAQAASETQFLFLTTQKDLLGGMHVVRFQKESLHKAISNGLDDLRRQLEKSERDAADEKTRVAQFTAELQNLNATPFDQEALDTAIAEVSKLETAMQEAASRLNTATKLQQDILRAVEAQEEHETAKTSLEAVKVAVAFLREKQQEGTNSLITGLLDTVNFFTDGIMVAPLVLHEGEIGYFLPDGRFVSHETFSGLESLLMYLAMGAALSSTGKLRIALLDELGNLTESKRIAVMDRCAEAVEKGILDQVLCVMPVDEGQSIMIRPEWQRIQLEATK